MLMLEERPRNVYGTEEQAGYCFLPYSVGHVAFCCSRDQAIVYTQIEESLGILRELGDKDGIAVASWVAGWVTFIQNDTNNAHSLIEQSA